MAACFRRPVFIASARFVRTGPRTHRRAPRCQFDPDFRTRTDKPLNTIAPPDHPKEERTRPELSVVVPVRNEEASIRPLIDEIVTALTELVSYEIIYVDDGSDDGTLDRLRATKREVPQLRILKHETGCGQSIAVLTGVRHARAPLIATLDGDGQNDPADIPALLARYRQEGPDARFMAAGRRAERKDNRVRLVCSWIANRVRRWLVGDDTPDSGCGLKLFRAEDFLAFPRFNHMHRFLPALMLRDGGRVVSMAVNHRARARGTSKYGVRNRLWVGIVDIFGVMWLKSRARRPVILDEE